MASSVVGVWHSRSMLRYLVRRDLAQKYQASAMGYLWSLIEPIGIGLIYYFVFVLVIGRGRQFAGLIPEKQYAVYLMAGIFSYMWTSGVLGQATKALTSQKNLITTMRVSRQVFPIARVFARSAEFLLGLPIVLALALALGVPLGWSLLFLPLAMLVQGTFLIGIALLLSSLNVMLRDIERFMSMIGRLIFYSSPILYPLLLVKENLPTWAWVIYQANPLVGIVELHHAAWFPTVFPSVPLLLSCIAGSLITLVLGWRVFRRLEPAVLKEL